MKDFKELLSLAQEEQEVHKELLVKYIVAEKKFRLTERRLKELEEQIAYRLKRSVSNVLVGYNTDPVLGIKIDKFKLNYFQSHSSLFLTVKKISHLNSHANSTVMLPDRFELLLLEKLSEKVNNVIQTVSEGISLIGIKIELD